jgi:hypothetical protein
MHPPFLFAAHRNLRYYNRLSVDLPPVIVPWPKSGSAAFNTDGPSPEPVARVEETINEKFAVRPQGPLRAALINTPDVLRRDRHHARVPVVPFKTSFEAGSS